MPWPYKLARLAVLAWGLVWPWARSFTAATLAALTTTTVLCGVAVVLAGWSAWFWLGVPGAALVGVVVWARIAGRSWARVMAGDGAGWGNPLSRSVGSWLRFRFPIEAANTNLTEMIRGRMRSPLLEEVSVDGAWLEPRRLHLGRWSLRWLPVLVVGRVKMRIKPLAQHRPDTDWPEIARRLQVRFDFAGHSLEPVGVNRFAASFTTTELASYAPFDACEWAGGVRGGAPLDPLWAIGACG